jgi:hypothetical protein
MKDCLADVVQTSDMANCLPDFTACAKDIVQTACAKDIVQILLDVLCKTQGCWQTQ